MPSKDLTDLEYQRFWRRLQQLGLNAYEARSYLVLVGHPRFKALELAARAHVPRQKIYEVLDSLVEKGFAQVIQERTKLFSAVEPGVAVPSYLERREQALKQEITDQSRLAYGLIEDLKAAYSEGQGGRGTLDYLQIISDPGQTAMHYRRMLTEVQTDYLEFSRPPYAVDPLDEQLVKRACERGVSCRLVFEAGSLDMEHLARVGEFIGLGVQVREMQNLPMKLALFDGQRGMIALLDPVITRPTWTTVLFEHIGLAEAMKGLFENYWNRSEVHKVMGFAR